MVLKMAPRPQVIILVVWLRSIFRVFFSDGGKRKCDDSAVDEERAAKNPRSSSPEPSADAKDLNAQDMLVLGLEWSVTDAELKQYFQQFGEIASAEVGGASEVRIYHACLFEMLDIMGVGKQMLCSHAHYFLLSIQKGYSALILG